MEQLQQIHSFNSAYARGQKHGKKTSRKLSIALKIIVSFIFQRIVLKLALYRLMLSKFNTSNLFTFIYKRLQVH